MGIGAKYIYDNLFPCVRDEYMSVEEQVVPGQLTKIVVGIFEDLKDALNPETRKAALTYLYRDIWKGIGAGYFCDEVDRRKGWTYGCGVRFRGFRVDIGDDSAIYDFPTSDYRYSLRYSW